MPSYRYTKDIKPEDLEGQAPPELTKKQKRANWWHYNLKTVLVIALFSGIGIFLVTDVLLNKQPDFVVGVLSPTGLSGPLLDKIQDEIEPYVGDLNGDGDVYVRVDTYVIDPTGTEIYNSTANLTKLAAAISVGEPVMFLVSEDLTNGYGLDYGLFGDREGNTVRELDGLDDIGAEFSQLQAFADVDLRYVDVNGELVDGHDTLADYRLAVSAAARENEDSLARWEKGWELYDALLAGTPPAA